MTPRFQPRSLVAVGALALAACHEHVGCTPVLTGEMSQLQFHDVVLVADACDRMHGVRALVTGSRFCPTLGCHPDVPGCGEDDDALTSAQVRACYDDTLAGPVETTDDGCIVAMAAGELDWSFTPIDCAATTTGYMPAADRLRLPIVAVDEVTAWLEAPGDAFAVRELVTATGESFPDDAQLGPGREALVLADVRVPFAVVLGHAQHADPVAWNPDQWTIAADAEDADLEWKAHGVVELALPAGASVELAIHRAADDAMIPVGRVRAVAADEIATLDVVVGFVRDDDASDGHRAPIGARAIARTAEGAPVWGIPVEWEVTEGALPVWRDADLPWSSDYVALMDREARACHVPPEHATTYDAAIVARWGEFEVEAPMRWREEAVDESAAAEIKEWFTGEDHENAEACEGPGFPSEGCSCASSRSRPGSPALALLVLAALGLRARRRH
jgi:MYXO-CTERM domain-containing protein